jgi:hypothetical protein
MAEMVQVRLETGATRLTCWVDRRKPFRVGNVVVITLKNSDDSDRLWTVRSIGEPKDTATIRTDWKVGGIATRAT